MTTESYRIARPDGGSLSITGGGTTGVMYGCLDVAEQVAMGTAVSGIEAHEAFPELEVRGLHDFLHNREAERRWVFDPEYWREYADHLARWRYNRFNLIYGHQTAYLIPIYTFGASDSRVG